MSDTSPGFLVIAFIVWAVACVALGTMFARRAPAVTLALCGSVLGAVSGFLVGNADRPAGVPSRTALGATIGLFTLGALGLVTTAPPGPSRSLRRAAWVVLAVAPFVAAALTVVLQVACPLYVSGKNTGFCNYQGGDVLGDWVTGVIALFLFDAVVVAGLLFISAWRTDIQSNPITVVDS